MLIMYPGALDEPATHVIEHIHNESVSAHTIHGVEQAIITAVQQSHTVDARRKFHPALFPAIPAAFANMVQKDKEVTKAVDRCLVSE